jgi:hypothetical protein
MESAALERGTGTCRTEFTVQDGHTPSCKHVVQRTPLAARGCSTGPDDEVIDADTVPG